MNHAGFVDGAQGQAVADLECALHDLAQPLTALAFLSQVARMQREPSAWKQALASAEVETRRAMHRLKEAQGAAARLMGTERLPQGAQ